MYSMDQERVVMQTGLEQDLDPTCDPRPSSGFEDTEESEEIDKFVDLESEEEDNDEDEDEDDFTFACAVDDESSSTADDMFDNGKIRPVFPLFDQSLVDHAHLPPVKNIFVATGALPPLVETAADRSGEVAGSHCAWSGKAVEAADPADSPEACNKSNSTGFSKIWRFKEMTNRSNSDGRDAFVFLNKLVPSKKTKDSTAAAAGKATTAVAAKKKGGGKGKRAATSISAHEVYMRSRAAATREEDRRRAYLSYKPVGFFTNVHGGLSKNVHPF